MPILPVSPGQYAARIAAELVRGLAVGLGMLVLVVVFLPLVPALLFWPVLDAKRVEWVLDAFLHTAQGVAELGTTKGACASAITPVRGQGRLGRGGHG